jgi:hypothetical protein
MSSRYRQQFEEEEAGEWGRDLPTIIRDEGSDNDPLDEEVADETLMAGKIPEKRRCVPIFCPNEDSATFYTV